MKNLIKILGIFGITASTLISYGQDKETKNYTRIIDREYVKITDKDSVSVKDLNNIMATMDILYALQEEMRLLGENEEYKKMDSLLVTVYDPMMNRLKMEVMKKIIDPLLKNLGEEKNDE